MLRASVPAGSLGYGINDGRVAVNYMDKPRECLQQAMLML
jgi:hypothetical protein